MKSRKLLVVYGAVGTLMWIAGMIVWDFTRDAAAVPYRAMFTSIAFAAWGSAFLSTLPLWRRIAALEEQIAGSKGDDVAS
jgi:hypothetical protein